MCIEMMLSIVAGCDFMMEISRRWFSVGENYCWWLNIYTGAWILLNIFLVLRWSIKRSSGFFIVKYWRFFPEKWWGTKEKDDWSLCYHLVTWRWRRLSSLKIELKLWRKNHFGGLVIDKGMKTLLEEDTGWMLGIKSVREIIEDGCIK